MPVAAFIPAIIGAAGAVGGAAIASHGATSAANTQAQAAQSAAQLNYQAQQNALDFQKQVYGNQQAELGPYFGVGTGALYSLANLMGITPYNSGQTGNTGFAGHAPGSSPVAFNDIPYRGGVGVTPRLAFNNGAVLDMSNGYQPVRQVAAGNMPGTPPGYDASTFGSLMTPFSEQFTAPTDITEQNDPGFQARLKLGQQALERSAAARGTVLSGGTLRDLNQYAQDYASNEYGNVYSRAMQEYLNRYNIFQQNQANQYNRLANIAGLGQTAAGQLTAAGQNAANMYGNTLINTTNAINQQNNNAAAARASGYAAGGNIWGQTLGNLGNLFGNVYAQAHPSQGVVTGLPDLTGMPTAGAMMGIPGF